MKRYVRTLRLPTLTLVVALSAASAQAAPGFSSLTAGGVEEDGGLEIAFTLVDQNNAVPYYNPQGVTVSGHAAATYACVGAGGYVYRTETIPDAWVQADYYYPFGADGVVEGELELYPPPSWMTCRQGSVLKLQRVTYFGVTAGYGLSRVGLAVVQPGTFERTFSGGTA